MPHYLSKYDSGIIPQLAYHLAVAGNTDKQIAELIGVAEKTFTLWKGRYPELREAMKPGKDFIDALVEGSMLKRALGYEDEEVTREAVATDWDVIGKSAVPTRWKMKVTKRVKKRVASDVVACIFWLKNRKPADWRDRNYLSISGSFKKPDSKLSDEELTTMKGLAAKAEAHAGKN
jgi:hypothetical protein